MKNRILTLCLMALLLSAATFAQDMLVGTYNIRNKNEGDSLRGECWGKRCQVICEQVNFMAPAIFGTQEVLHVQLQDLLHGLRNYDCIGVARDDGKTKGEYAAIFYERSRIRLLSHGDFWLNETPDRPALGWDAACIRICTWGKFKDLRSGKKFYFFNLHMDHVGRVARREAARLVVDKIREIAGKRPVVLTGDFNVDQTDEIYRIFTESGILADSYVTAGVRFAENGTFNAFNPLLKTSSRIDHIFLSPGMKVDAYGVLTDSYWTPNTESSASQKASDAPQEISFAPYTRRNPSDHYPVMVRIRWR
ncbi:MAG: endonuclease/exonuclease/phosphatase family protein [Prevotella sp.]|nr:endonuclease/exonuclease/phosphatase family protein [Prevotella sp.]